MIPEIAMSTPRARQRYDNALALMRIAQKMTAHGFRVDLARIREHEQAAQQRIERFTSLFLQLTGLHTDDLGASGGGTTVAVRDYFWQKCGAPHVEFDRRTKRPQFNTACLSTYATAYKGEQFGPPAAALIGLRKNKRSLEFLHNYQKFAEADGRIHFGFNAVGTVTGRWTSSTKLRQMQDDGTRKLYSANAQQIPTKVPEFDFGAGKEPLVASLRDVFIPDKGCVLLKADYDQLELRLIAYVYAVKELLRIIDLGDKADAHCFTAAHLFKELPIRPDELKPSKADAARDPRLKKLLMARDAAKSCAYGISYQMHSDNGRYPQLTKTLKGIFPDLTERHVAVMAQRFFTIYPEIKSGQLRQKAAVENDGYAELTIDGRRLYYPATMRGFNQALNFPMQGTGGALCNRALLELEPQLDWQGGCQVRVQVHDELLVQAPYARASEVAEKLTAAMSRPAQIGASFAGIPAAADPGLSWGDCKAWNIFCNEHPSLLA